MQAGVMISSMMLWIRKGLRTGGYRSSINSGSKRCMSECLENMSGLGAGGDAESEMGAKSEGSRC